MMEASPNTQGYTLLYRYDDMNNIIITHILYSYENQNVTGSVEADFGAVTQSSCIVVSDIIAQSSNSVRDVVMS